MITNIDYKIILPTIDKYLPITKNFIALLTLNWPETRGRIILSVSGKAAIPFECADITVVRSKKGTSLPECIRRAVVQNDASIYLSFLGDAFINKRINDAAINNLFVNLLNNGINYCNLNPETVAFKLFRTSAYHLLSNKERYGHSFVAFAFTKQFMENEFSENITDRDFELKYLPKDNEHRKLYKDRAILNKNIFNLYPSLQKGKWDTWRIYRLKSKYPQVNFVKLEHLSTFDEILVTTRRLIFPYIPNLIRRVFKRILGKRDSILDTDD